MVDQKKLIDLFLELVKIDGISLQERHVADFVYERLSALAVTCSEDDAARKINGNSGNLIIRLGASRNGQRPLLLAAHLDTVRSTAQVQPIVENGIIKSDGKTILGADNRAGVAVLLYLIETLVSQNLKHRPLEVVFTVAEELGMYGARALDFSILKAREGYILDCSRDVGYYVATTPTAVDFKLEFQGRAAHSGIAPEKGINALSMAVDLLAQFPVGRIDQDTVANVGMIHGGGATNVVPEWISAQGEIRSFNDAKIADLQKLLEANAAAVAQKYRGKINIEWQPGFQGFKLKQKDHAVQVLETALQEMGYLPEGLVYYGGSDANVYNAQDITAVNIGIGASNPHSNEEYISVKNLNATASLMLKLVEARSI